jgi:hypothetical protein
MTKQSIAQFQQLDKSFEKRPVESVIRPEEQPERVGTFEGFGKGFKVFLDENSILASTRYIMDEGFVSTPTDPDFDPIKDIPEDKLGFIDRYTYANTPEEVGRISARIDREEENNRIIREEVGTGAAILSGIGAGTLDIINLVPIAGTAYKALRVGKVAQGALRTGTAGLVSSAAIEGVLQTTEETRTAEESLMNVAAGTILSGIIGAGASVLSKGDFKDLANRVQKDTTEPKSELEIDPETQEIIPRSIGAKQLIPFEELHLKHIEEQLALGKEPLSLEEFSQNLESLAPGIGGSAKVISKALSKINPLLRTFNAKSKEAKIVLQELATHNMIVGKNEAGIASQQSVETAVKQWRAGIGEAIPSNNKQFKAFRKRFADEGKDLPFKSQREFNVEVSKSMRRGDVSDIPEVQQAAREWRSKVFEPLKNEAIATKLLPEDVKPETAISYLSRIWNRKAVIANEPELRKIISTKLNDFEIPKIEAIRKQELLDMEIKIARLGKKKTKKLTEMQQAFNKKRIEFDIDFDNKDLYTSNIVDSILANLKGETRFGAVTNYDFKITNRGPLKERTLSFIRDEEVEQFLENDIVEVANRYTKIMGTDVELARKFDGDVNLEGRLNDVTEEYKKLAAEAKTDKERVAVQDEKKQVLGDLGALRDIMRGTYGTPDDPDSLIVRGFRVGRQLNYASKLGGVAISSIPDSARTITLHGFKRFTKGLNQAITNTKGIKLSIAEAKKAGNVLEQVLHTRLATMAELTDPLHTGQSVFERFMGNVASLGTKLNGIALWNDIQKGFSSVVTQQRMIEEMDNLVKGKIKKGDKTYLAFLGIDQDNVNIIKSQLDEHSFKEGGLDVANTKDWTDPEAVSMYRNALNQDVDRTIVSKTAGDVPLFMNSELGKTVGQFKSFTFASTQQVLLAGLQQGDASALNGLITSVALGSLVYYLKTKGVGKEPSDDPRKWIAEGLDRSGYLGIIMEANNLSEKMSRGTVGINPLIGGEIMSRYMNRNGAGSLAGPSAGLIQDTFFTIPGAIATGDIKESDIRAFRRNLPYQNLFYLQAAERAFNKK